MARLSASFAHGVSIATKYTPLEFTPQKGQIILSDFSTLHATTRKPGAGARVSIDTSFRMKRTHIPGEEEFVHPTSVEEYLPGEVLVNIGRDYVFAFPDRVEDPIVELGGNKRSTNLQLVELFA